MTNTLKPVGEDPQVTGKRDPLHLAIGIVLLLGVIALARYDPGAFEGATRLPLRIICAVAGGFVGSALPGVIGLEIRGVRAAGSIALVVFFFLFSDDGLPSERKAEPEAKTSPAEKAEEKPPEQQVEPAPALKQGPAATNEPPHGERSVTGDIIGSAVVTGDDSRAVVTNRKSADHLNARDH